LAVLWFACGALDETPLPPGREHGIPASQSTYREDCCDRRNGQEPKDAEHRLFPTASDVKDDEGHVLVTAYAHERPDGQWSLMLVNRDYDHPHQVRIVFHNTEATETTFSPVQSQ